jgi:hypothetical protein
MARLWAALNVHKAALVLGMNPTVRTLGVRDEPTFTHLVLGMNTLLRTLSVGDQHLKSTHLAEAVR